MDVSGRLWPHPELRVGDADRRGVVAELQRHFVDGRLTSDELSERVAQALKARTFGELAQPLGDLPKLADSTSLVPTGQTQEDAHHGGLGVPVGALLVLIGVVSMLSMFAVHPWHLVGIPFWPILIWGFFIFVFPFGRRRRGGRRDRWHRGGPPARFL
jgi:hypothetical protein